MICLCAGDDLLYEVRLVAGNERGCGLVYTSHLFYTTHTGRKQTTDVNTVEQNLLYCTSFPDPPLLHMKEGLVYQVGIIGCADSAVVGKLCNNHVICSTSV